MPPAVDSAAVVPELDSQAAEPVAEEPPPPGVWAVELALVAARWPAAWFPLAELALELELVLEPAPARELAQVLHLPEQPAWASPSPLELEPETPQRPVAAPHRNRRTPLH